MSLTSDQPDRLTDRDRADMAASFQDAVSDIVKDRAVRALDRFAEEHGFVPSLVVAGGVAANLRLRAVLTGLAEDRDARFVAPPISLCTDNAAMVAWAGVERLRLGLVDGYGIAPRPRWPLDPDAIVKKGNNAHGALRR